MSQPVKMLKVLLTGDGDVGKTSLITQFIHSRIRPNYKATIGVDIFKKEVTTNQGDRVILQIWDLSGQSHFGKIRNRFYAGADGQIVVFDITNVSSLLSINGWIEEASMNLDDKAVILPKIIVGNKIDLPKGNHIDQARMESEINPMSYSYYQASAMTGENVDLIFIKITEEILTTKRKQS
ncbi:MAG: Rab family GTPase [Candidatus Hodarchaeales archaeon]|jgi:Ras-related protein Rab-35